MITVDKFNSIKDGPLMWRRKKMKRLLFKQIEPTDCNAWKEYSIGFRFVDALSVLLFDSVERDNNIVLPVRPTFSFLKKILRKNDKK